MSAWRNWLIAGLLLAAVAASWLLLDRRSPPATAAQPPTDTGYYMRVATIEGIGSDGRRLYTLHAERIVQQTDADSVALEAVDLQYEAPAQEPWRLTAIRGSISANGELIELAGGVTIEESLFEGPEATVITTPELAVDLRAQLATTEAAVRIERGNYLITATGLRADLKDRIVTLQSEVHGRFLP